MKNSVSATNTIPRVSHEEAHALTARMAVARQGPLSNDQAAQAKQRPVVVKQATHVSKKTPQECLRQAFLRLLAQGEKITRTRLRQEAGVSTDAARTFLRAQRAGDANPDPPIKNRHHDGACS